MKHNKSIEAFSLLVRAGLFGRTEHAERLLQDDVDWAEVYQLAKEQGVVGLAVAGIETLQSEWLKTHGSPLIQPKWSLKFVRYTLRIEQNNLAINRFIARLISLLCKNGIEPLLIKGQAVAKSYEKPLWRTYGDVDLLLSEEDYQKAQNLLLPFASFEDSENEYKKHKGLKIDKWMVELHGSLRCGYSSRVDKALDQIYQETFESHSIRAVSNNFPIFTLEKENDVVYVFAHFLKHFYKGGVGVRQICDWCRLLWFFRDSLNLVKLRSRIENMRLMSEWRAFGMYAVEYLGMPETAMPFYADTGKWRRKARRIHSFVMMAGNMGINRKDCTKTVSYLTRKTKSSKQRFRDLVNHFMIFPLDSLRFFPSIVMSGIRQK